MSTSGRWLAGVSLLGLVAAATFSPWTTEVSTAAPDSVPVLTQGVLLDHGAPITGGVVVAFAWPDQDTIANLADGASTQLVPIGWSRTSRSGQFSIAASPNDLPAQVVDAHGNVNVELMATSRNQTLAFNESSTFNQDATGGSPVGWVSKSDGDAADTTPSLELDLGNHTARDTHNDPSRWLDAAETALGQHDTNSKGAAAVLAQTPALEHLLAHLPAGAAGSLLGASSGGNTVVPSVCYVTKTAYVYKNKPEHFVTTQTMTNIPETITESSSASHTLGIAISGTNGSWSESGTASISRTSTASASTTYSVAHTIYNRVNYRDWNNGCLSATERRPDSFYDILTNDGSTVSETWFYNCGTHKAGDTWDSGTATNITYGAGVTLTVANLSAQSGYASSLNVHYKFNVNGEVCGNSTSGPLYSSRVEADSWE
jgi:hypothetical protein